MLLRTKIQIPYRRNYVQSGCVIMGFHCTTLMKFIISTENINDFSMFTSIFCFNEVYDLWGQSALAES